MKAAQKRAPTGAHAFGVALWCALCAPCFAELTEPVKVVGENGGRLATEQTAKSIEGILDTISSHANSIDSHQAGSEAWLIRIYNRQLDDMTNNASFYRVVKPALGTITNQFRSDWFSSMHGGENYVSSTRGYHDESDEITQAAEYSNMTNSWSSIGEVERPQIDDIDVRDSHPDSPSITGELGSFNSSFRIIDADVMADICSSLGLSPLGAWDVDFGSSGANSVVSAIGDMMSEVWLFVGRLFQVFVVLAWWRRIRDFLFSLLGQPEPTKEGAFR